MSPLEKDFEFDQEKRVKKKSVKKTVAIAIIIICILGLAGFLLFQTVSSRPAGLLVKTSLSDGDEAPDSLANSVEGGTASTGAAVTPDISVNLALELDHFTFPVAESDITISTEEIVIESTDQKIALELDSPLVLKQFTGVMRWRDNEFYFEGNLYESMTSGMKIDWRDKRSVKLVIKSGTVYIANINIPHLDSIASGTASFDSGKMTAQLSRDQISMDNYAGPIKITIGDTNNVILTGSVTAFKVGTSSYNVNIG